MLRYLLVLAFLLSTSKAWVIEAFDVQNLVKSRDNRYSYKIEAKRYLKDIDNLKKNYRYFNRKRVLQKYNFYEKGKLFFKDNNFSFKKSYRVDNYLYIYKTSFFLNSLKYKSKECKIDISKNLLLCKHTKLYKNKKFFATKISFRKYL